MASASDSLALPDASAPILAERLDALSAEERTLLLDWARRAELSFGPWRSWKKVLKIADTRALQGQAVDTELLGALLWRVDTHTPEARDHTWKKIEDAQPWRTYGRIVQAQSETHRFRIARNSAVGYRCWEVRVSPLSTPAAPALPGRRNNSGDEVVPGEVTWRFEGSEYAGDFKNAKIQGSILSFEGQYRGSYRIDISDLSFLHIVGDGPSNATWGYLKRRARRLMRKLAARNSELFWQVLVAYAREGGAVQAQPKPLSLAWAWLADDLFLGRSPKLVQERRGRGVVKIAGRFFWRRARLERAPEIWDAHIAEARALMLDPRTLPEAGAVAFNVLRSRGQSETDLLGAMSEAVLERWAGGGVAWARSAAFNELARRWSANSSRAPGGEASARLLIEAGARTRRAVQVLVARALESAGGEWKQAFARALQSYLDAAPALGNDADLSGWTRRARTSARAVFELVRESITTDAFWKYLPLWARLAGESNDALGMDWIETRVVEAARRGQLERLADLARLGESERERMSEAFVRGAAGAKIDNTKAINLLTGFNAQTTLLAWRLIEASAMGPSGLRSLFEALYGRYYSEGEQAQAIYGDEAARVWERAEWSEKDMRRWIEGADATGYNSWNSPWVRVLPHASGRFFLCVLELLAARLSNQLGSANTIRARYGLRGIVALPPSSQDAVVEGLRQATWRFEPTQDDLTRSMLSPGYYTRPQSYEGGWKVLAMTQIAPEIVRANWQALFSLPIEAGAAQAAIQLWERAGIDSSDVSPWLATKTLSSFAPEFLAFLLRRQPALLFESLARADESQAAALQVLVREFVADAARRSGFWEGLWPRLHEDAMRDVIQTRLLSDEAIFSSFALLPKNVASELFISGREEGEGLLLLWLDANESTLERDDLVLLNASISPLPPVHERALRRLESLGLTLPLALRLWESLLPPAIGAARRFAERAEAGSEEEAEVAIALCDSPSPEVQRAGRDFISARASRLLSAVMLQRLSENTNPAMQSWVAGLLNERLIPAESAALAVVDEASQPEEAASDAGVLEPREFDRVVLRERLRAREAKEKVKHRLARTEEGNLEPAVLLEMARGRVARDREWALGQIARLQLAGVEVEGVQVLGER